MTLPRITNTLRSIVASALVVLAASDVVSASTRGWAWQDTLSGAVADAPQPRFETIRLAQDSCSSAASEAAAQTGGQVLSVSMSQKGGQTVCVVTVLIPGHDGDRPRRTTVRVPL